VPGPPANGKENRENNRGIQRRKPRAHEADQGVGNRPDISDLWVDKGKERS